jgi:prepilin-type processing-associated H-X9-DG protein
VNESSHYSPLRSCLFVCGIMFVGLFLFIYLSQHNDYRPEKPTCSRNLLHIANALKTYHLAHHCFPPAYVADANGKPLYSWRVLLLPNLELCQLYQQFNRQESWDGTDNNKTSHINLQPFLCPNNPNYKNAIDSESDTIGVTNYVAVVGPNTVWTGTSSTRLEDIRDPSKTILLVETTSPIPWSAPQDLSIDDAMRGVNPTSGGGISSSHANGVNVVFADGSVHFISNDISPDLLAALLSRDVDADALQQYNQILGADDSQDNIICIIYIIIPLFTGAGLLFGLIIWLITRRTKHKKAAG